MPRVVGRRSNHRRRISRLDTQPPSGAFTVCRILEDFPTIASDALEQREPIRDGKERTYAAFD